MSDTSIAIVGAGVIGASVALALQQDHHRVTLLDRDKPCAGASFGNAGVIVNASCIPTAMPGIVFDALKMIFKRQSPLSIKANYIHRIAPWLIRFVLESRRSNVNQNARQLHALTAHAASDWQTLVDNTILARLLEASGWLKVYETEHSFSGTNDARALMDDIGTDYEVLTARDIQDLEPQLAPIYEHGIFQGDSLNIVNPQRMVRGMVDLLVARGGHFEKFDVEVIHSNVDNVTVRNSDEKKSFDIVVITAGARSRLLTTQLGEKIPLDTERGYHLMLRSSEELQLNRTVMNGDGGFVLAPMETGLRLSSQVEFAGVDAAPDYRYIRQLLPQVRRMLPGTAIIEDSAWMGCRPSLPDSLPVLGMASKSERIFYAFGHQHLGMTLGPVSGRLIADQIAGRKSDIDLVPYRANRF